MNSAFKANPLILKARKNQMNENETPIKLSRFPKKIHLV
jgi:hypothetical protein